MQSVPAAMKNYFPLNIIDGIRERDLSDVLWAYSRLYIVVTAFHGFILKQISV